MLRELMHMGQIIQSHALSFFHLSAPDMLLGFDSDPLKRNVIGLVAAAPDIAVKGVLLRLATLAFNDPKEVRIVRPDQFE